MRGAHWCTLVIAVGLPNMYIDVTLISYINVVYVCDPIRYALRRVVNNPLVIAREWCATTYG